MKKQAAMDRLKQRINKK